MKSFLMLLATTTGLVAAQPAADFHQHLGLQLWSLGSLQKQGGMTAVLDQTKAYGFTEVETAGFGNLTAAQLAGELKSRGLVAIAVHIPLETLKTDIQAAIADAKTLGAKFVICPMLVRTQKFDEAAARAAAADFNRWGAACQAAGLRFGYHIHGFEFVPLADGSGATSMDLLLRETKPELVGYEMDVFWVAFAGVDPVKLLEKYPGRWPLLHLKDLRKGVVTGSLTGKTPAADKVAIGAGQIDWPAVLRAARQVGAEHYFIEDETAAPLESIPPSIQYLAGLKL